MEDDHAADFDTERMAAAKKLLVLLDGNSKLNEEFTEEELAMLKEMVGYMMGIRSLARMADILKRFVTYVGWIAGLYAAWKLGWIHAIVGVSGDH